MILTPYYLGYYVNEKDLKTPKGEIPISGETRVTKDDGVVGFGFKIVTGGEQLLVSAEKEADRTEWLRKLTLIISYAKSFLMDTLIEINTAKINLKPDDISSIDTSKYESQKCFIFADEYLTVHPNDTTLSSVEKVINILHSTVMKRKKHQRIIYEINDSSNNSVFIAFPENASVRGKKKLDTWLSKLGEVITIKELPVEIETASGISAAPGSASSKNGSSLITPARDATSRESIMFNLVSVMDDFEDDEIWEQNSKGVWFAHIVHTGFLEKLARQSGRNWKRRYFKLTPFFLSYAENDRSEAKGSIAMSSHCFVENDDENISSSTVQRFGFKIVSPIETMHLAATTDTERTMWMTYIAAAIEYSKKFTLEYLSIVDHAKYAAKHRHDTVHDVTSMSKYEEFKYLVMTDRFLSIHPTKEDITKIDIILRLNSTTKARRLLHSAYVYEIVDSKGGTAWLHFNDMTSLGRKVYETWKTKLQSIIDFQDIVQLPFSNPNATYSASSTASTSTSFASKPLMFDAAAFMKQNRWSADLVPATSTASPSSANAEGSNEGNSKDIVSKRPFSSADTKTSASSEVTKTSTESAPIATTTSSKSASLPSNIEIFAEATNTTSEPSGQAAPKNALQMAAARKQRKSGSAASVDSRDSVPSPTFFSGNRSRASSTVNDTTRSRASSSANDLAANTSSSPTAADPLLTGYKSYMRTNLAKLSSYLDEDNESSNTKPEESVTEHVSAPLPVAVAEEVVPVIVQPVAPAPPPPPPPPPPPSQAPKVALKSSPIVVVPAKSFPTTESLAAPEMSEPAKLLVPVISPSQFQEVVQLPPVDEYSWEDSEPAVTDAIASIPQITDSVELTVPNVKKPETVSDRLKRMQQERKEQEVMAKVSMSEAANDSVQNQQQQQEESRSRSSSMNQPFVAPLSSPSGAPMNALQMAAHRRSTKRTSSFGSSVSERGTPTNASAVSPTVSASSSPIWGMRKSVLNTTSTDAAAPAPSSSISILSSPLWATRKTITSASNRNSLDTRKPAANSQSVPVHAKSIVSSIQETPVITKSTLPTKEVSSESMQEVPMSSISKSAILQEKVLKSSTGIAVAGPSVVIKPPSVGIPEISREKNSSSIDSKKATIPVVNQPATVRVVANAGNVSSNLTSACRDEFFMKTTNSTASTTYDTAVTVDTNSFLFVNVEVSSEDEAPPVVQQAVGKKNEEKVTCNRFSFTKLENDCDEEEKPIFKKQSEENKKEMPQIPVATVNANGFLFANVESESEEDDELLVMKQQPVETKKDVHHVPPATESIVRSSANNSIAGASAMGTSEQVTVNTFFMSNEESDSASDTEAQIRSNLPATSPPAPSVMASVVKQMDNQPRSMEKTFLERSASKDYRLSTHQEMAHTTNENATIASNDPLRLILHNSFTSPSQRNSLNVGNNNGSHINQAENDPIVGDHAPAGYVNALDMFKVAKNKPVVRIVFENYAYREQFVDCAGLQNLGYDLAYYMSMDDVTKFMDKYSSSQSNLDHQQVLSYEDFQVFWRDHPYFKTVRLQDPMMKRRVVVASKFKQFDLLGQGFIRTSQFDRLYQDLVEEGYLNNRRHRSDSIVKKLDGDQRGKITLGRFIDWIDMNVTEVTQKQSTLGRLWGSFSSNSSRQPSPLPILPMNNAGSPNSLGNLSRTNSSHNSRSTSPSDLSNFRLRNSLNNNAPSQQLFANAMGTGSPAASNSDAPLLYRTTYDAATATATATPPVMNMASVALRKPNADFIPITVQQQQQLQQQQQQQSFDTERARVLSNDDVSSVTSSVIELTFSPQTPPSATKKYQQQPIDNVIDVSENASNAKKKTPFTRRRSVLTKKAPAVTGGAAEATSIVILDIEDEMKESPLATTSKLSFEDVPEKKPIESKPVPAASLAVEKSTLQSSTPAAPSITSTATTIPSSTEVSADGSGSFTNPMARFRPSAAKTAASNDPPTAPATATAAAITVVTSAEQQVKSSTAPQTAVSGRKRFLGSGNGSNGSGIAPTASSLASSENTTRSAVTANSSKQLTEKAEITPLPLSTDVAPSASSASLGSGSRSVFAALKSKKQEQQQHQKQQIQLRNTDFEDDFAENEGPFSPESAFQDGGKSVACVLPPNMALFQQKKKPVKTFKVTSRALLSNDESLLHPVTQRAANFQSPSDVSIDLSLHTSNHRRATDNKETSDLSLMMLSTEDFMEDFRQRLRAQVEQFPVEFTNSLNQQQQQGVGEYAHKPPSSSAKERLFSLLQNPQLLSTPTTAIANNTASTSIRSDTTKMSVADDQEQLSLYHKMLLSRHLLWDGLQQLPHIYAASQQRILEAKQVSHERIRQACEESRDQVESLHTQLLRLHDAFQQEVTHTESQLQASCVILQKCQAARRNQVETVQQQALRQAIHALARKQEEIHAQERQLRQQARAVLCAQSDLAQVTKALEAEANHQAEAEEEARVRQQCRNKEDFFEWKKRKQMAKEAQHLLHAMSMEEHDALLQSREDARNKKIHRLLAMLH
jgi:uncharacterized membrane protein